MVTYLGSLVQYCCGDRGTLQTDITGMCGECLQCLGHTGFALVHGTCTFPLYTSQALGCSAGELSEAGPGLCALPRSNPVRFRFSGTSQRGRLGWACVLCPSQVRAAQATRCLASAVSPGGECILPPPRSSRSVSWVAAGAPVSSVSYVSSGELISGWDPSGRSQPSRIPRGFG